ncbi:RecF/RecN/SMC [Protomyces lactucae-debilis]|uniref:Structural maintenance of chromosomes protein n=1 Tax=Protomyces lactucae-debilis TaxID=2754530 RepID=A0A1Y2FLT8_PROLT|nr:RecF/RecN/SMC [Protomyces lactucae-debilis]ORY83735.1 RecF/RecN/SMC [Protomyces lactucae-debilis]
MRIESLVIDGFKSYAVRTEVFFDATFTAITGLNGSGKSNILDAICFVLGITNMTTLRAQNLQDLIYKRGQAGITKASVTIVFANDVEKTSPVGFSSKDHPTISVTRQIVMGGTSKYLIDGRRAQQQSVQNLFQSVQLNINNPNFLIMQGRITKVLNMKPLEILSMIEEAAGTRMFEERKEKAIRNIAKKEAKVQEINALLAEEIDPKLDKLRLEKRAWLEFQQTQMDMERTSKLVVAHDYDHLTSMVQNAGEALRQRTDAIVALEAAQTRMKHEMGNIEQQVKEIHAKRDKEVRKGGRYAKLEEEAKALSHELVRLTTNIELKQESLREDKSAASNVEAQRQQLQVQMTAKQAAYKAAEVKHVALRTAFTETDGECAKKDELLQTLSTGFAAKEGQDSGYLDLLADAQKRAAQAATEQEQAKLKIAHCEKSIKEAEPKSKLAEQRNRTLRKELDVLRQEVLALEKKLSKLGIDPGAQSQMQTQQRDLKANIRQMTSQADTLRRKVANLDFSYSDPTPNFDRSQVKGLVAQLFTLDQQHFASATALEICAGGRLYNVVVENEKVGSLLLSGGKLRKRVTIIPLNKISAMRASAEKLGAAQRLAPGKVELALSLVGYDDEVAKAMEFVFGTTLICADAETAKRVTFDPQVKLKSVTLEGDVYDPSGTLSGGSKPNSAGVLITLQQLNEVGASLSAAQSQLQQLESQLEKDAQRHAQAAELTNQLDLKHHEVSVREEQIGANSDSRILTEIDELRTSIQAFQSTIATAKEAQEIAKRDVKQVERDMAEFKSNKGGKLSALKKEVEALRKTAASQGIAAKEAAKAYQALQLEQEQLASEAEAAQEQLSEMKASLAQHEEELATLAQTRKEVSDRHDALAAELADERSRLTAFDTELEELNKTRELKVAAVAQAGLDCAKQKHQLDEFKKENGQVEQRLQKLVAEQPWIPECVDDFGKPGGMFDYRAADLKTTREHLKTLTERFTVMRKRVNAKVMNMIEGVEKKETSLKQMVRTIHKDKLKIEETIVSLEAYKVKALDETWQKVTVDFGNIFGELLPGNTAKLVPLEGRDVTAGLEVKVCLGKVWKQSLTELSGGQRSLIALSLIMSLLQYKPAPMYILDEVDAALDLSHTQNIGALIKSRFKGSQFIVVSLKEGMFTNANRIFRTKFVDNTSVVYISNQ